MSAGIKQKLQMESQEGNKKRKKEAGSRSGMWNFLPQGWDSYWDSCFSRIDRGSHMDTVHMPASYPQATQAGQKDKQRQGL